MSRASWSSSCWLFEALGPRTRLVIGAGTLAVLLLLTFWPARP